MTLFNIFVFSCYTKPGSDYLASDFSFFRRFLDLTKPAKGKMAMDVVRQVENYSCLKISNSSNHENEAEGFASILVATLVMIMFTILKHKGIVFPKKKDLFLFYKSIIF